MISTSRETVAQRRAAQDRVKRVGLNLRSGHAVPAVQRRAEHVAVAAGDDADHDDLAGERSGRDTAVEHVERRHATDRPRRPSVIDPRRALALPAHGASRRRRQLLLPQRAASGDVRGRKREGLQLAIDVGDVFLVVDASVASVLVVRQAGVSGPDPGRLKRTGPSEEIGEEAVW